MLKTRSEDISAYFNFDVLVQTDAKLVFIIAKAVFRTNFDVFDTIDTNPAIITAKDDFSFFSLPLKQVALAIQRPTGDALF